MENVVNRKKPIILFVLSFLLLLIIGTITFFFLKNHCLNNLGELNPFKTAINTCTIDSNVNLKGILYNITEDESSYTFDVNLWNTETKEDTYIEGITLAKDNGVIDFQYSFDGYYPVSIYLTFNRDTNIIISPFVEKDYTLESWSIQPETLTKDEYKGYIQTLYSEMISNTDKSIESNGDLYKPWIESYLNRYTEFTDIGVSSESLDTIAQARIVDTSTELECSEDFPCGDITGDTYNTTTSYVTQYGYACLLLKEMKQNNISIEDTELEAYCPIEKIENDMETYSSSSYDFNSILGSVELSRIQSEEDITTPGIPNPDFISLPADLDALKSLYNINIPSAYYTTTLSMIQSSLTNPEDTNLKKTCSLAYSLSMSSINFKQSYLDILKTVIFTNKEEFVKLFSDDVYALTLCYEAYSNDSEMKVFLNNNLLKAVYLDNGSYDISIDARLIKILLERYVEGV